MGSEMCIRDSFSYCALTRCCRSYKDNHTCEPKGAACSARTAAPSRALPSKLPAWSHTWNLPWCSASFALRHRMLPTKKERARWAWPWGLPCDCLGAPPACFCHHAVVPLRSRRASAASAAEGGPRLRESRLAAFAGCPPLGLIAGAATGPCCGRPRSSRSCEPGCVRCAAPARRDRRPLLSYATWLCVFGFLCLRFGFWIFYDYLFIYLFMCHPESILSLQIHKISRWSAFEAQFAANDS